MSGTACIELSITSLYNVCAVPWGYSVPWGVLSTVGISRVPWRDILSTVGVFSAVGDIMSTMGAYLEYRGGCSLPWGNHDARGGYHEYHGGCSVPWGISSFEI